MLLLPRLGPKVDGTAWFGLLAADGFMLMNAAKNDHEPPVLLELSGVGRTFGPLIALRDVSVQVRLGKVLGLIGENGAGKSTLLNIVCGTDRPTTGVVKVRGAPVAFQSYHDAARAGVFRVFQELALIPTLSVWENLFLGHEHLLMRGGFIQRGKAIRLAQTVFERFDHGWIDVTKTVGDLPFSVQQLVEILRAFALAELLGQSQPILLLDEPTAGLSSEEIEFLHRLVERVRPHSATLFVSHRLSELLEWSDNVLILKDGAMVGAAPAKSMSEQQLHRLMVGRERQDAFYCEDRQREPEGDVVLHVTDFGDGATFRGVDFEIRKGEILGVTGVIGSGKSELGRALFGDGGEVSGELAYRGRRMGARSVREAARAAIGYVPPDRKDEGILDTFSVNRNISLARITTQEGGLLSLRREAREGQDFIDRLRIKTASPTSSILSLSGGNQQKAILARWLARGVDLLILDNPTRGIDAGAKSQIYALLREFADKGMAILLISDDLLEVIGLSNRILVMKDKVVTSRMEAKPGAKPSEADLIAAMV